MTGASQMGLWLQQALFSGNFIRAINYHGTPAGAKETLRQHLEFFRRHFTGVSLADLDAFYSTGAWPKKLPGLIISFDDGLRNNYEIAAPLLDEFGFVGWFFVPTAFVGLKDGLVDFVDNQHIFRGNSEADQAPLNWQQVKDLAARHVVGSHTQTHVRLTKDMPAGVLQVEIWESKRVLEQQLGTQVRCFCWVGGEEDAYSRSAARAVREAGYDYSFMTNSAPVRPNTSPHHLQRTNIEAAWPLDLVRLQLSGLVDLRYWPKRTRVNRLTARDGA